MPNILSIRAGAIALSAACISLTAIGACAGLDIGMPCNGCRITCPIPVATPTGTTGGIMVSA